MTAEIWRPFDLADAATDSISVASVKNSSSTKVFISANFSLTTSPRCKWKKLSFHIFYRVRLTLRPMSVELHKKSLSVSSRVTKWDSSPPSTNQTLIPLSTRCRASSVLVGVKLTNSTNEFFILQQIISHYYCWNSNDLLLLGFEAPKTQLTIVNFELIIIQAARPFIRRHLAQRHSWLLTCRVFSCCYLFNHSLILIFT